MKSKWVWISEKLDELGFKQLAEMAKTIEGHLKEIFGETVTEDWKKDYESKEREFQEAEKVYDKLWVLYWVIRSPKYCIGCQRTLMRCDICTYGLRFGICGDEGSEFNRLLYAVASLAKHLSDTEPVDDRPRDLAQLFLKYRL